MPKMKKLNRPSITAAIKKYNINYAYVAKRANISIGDLRNILYYKGSMAHVSTFEIFERVFKFDFNGHVVCIPEIEEERRRKEQIILNNRLKREQQIREHEKSRLIKTFLINLLVCIGLYVIIVFGYSGFVEWVK